MDKARRTSQNGMAPRAMGASWPALRGFPFPFSGPPVFCPVRRLASWSIEMTTPNPTRRDLLKSVLAATVPLGAASAISEAFAQIKPEPGSDKLTAYQDGPQIWIRWANRLVLSYRAHPTQKYPYLYPFSGPVSGLSLTAETCVPYPHHRSVFFACDRVNGGNYWQGPIELGQIVSRGLRLGVVTPQSAEIHDVCEWRRPGQEPVMTDSRKITLHIVNDQLRWIDAEIQWTAVRDVTIEKTNHALFSVRAAADLIPWAGGTLENAAGQSGEKATFGQPAAWCTYYNRRSGIPGDVVEGVALFDHPTNPWKDCPWFTRDYGFISPSPFNFLEKPWQLAAGKSVWLRYRVVGYARTPKEADLEGIYKAWAGT